MRTDDAASGGIDREGCGPGLNARALVLVGILTLLWGTTWPLMPIAVREVSVWTFRAAATFGAGVILMGVARARGQSLAVAREHWLTLGSSAIVYVAVWGVASTYSAVLIPSGQAAVLSYTMPFWAALISWMAFGERPARRMVLATVLAAAAITLLMWPNFGVYARAPLGLVLGLLAGLGWAGGTVILKRGAPPIPVTVLTAWQLVIAGVPISVVALLASDGHWIAPSWPSLAAIAYIVLIPMAIGNLCWFAIVGLLPAYVAGMAAILVPVVALVSGAIVHGEPLGLIQWLAMGCCAAALSLALLRPAPAAREG